MTSIPSTPQMMLTKFRSLHGKWRTALVSSAALGFIEMMHHLNDSKCCLLPESGPACGTTSVAAVVLQGGQPLRQAGWVPWRRSSGARARRSRSNRRSCWGCATCFLLTRRRPLPWWARGPPPSWPRVSCVLAPRHSTPPPSFLAASLLHPPVHLKCGPHPTRNIAFHYPLVQWKERGKTRRCDVAPLIRCCAAGGGEVRRGRGGGGPGGRPPLAPRAGSGGVPGGGRDGCASPRHRCQARLASL